MHFLHGKGVAVGGASINIVDRRMLRMVRQLKTEKGIDVPKELLRDLPGTFRRREAVLWDKKKGNLVYVFDLPGDPKKGKFVVEVNFNESVQRGDKVARTRGNFIRSGGVVPRRNLVDENMYETVEGKL